MKNLFQDKYFLSYFRVIFQEITTANSKDKSTYKLYCTNVLSLIASFIRANRYYRHICHKFPKVLNFKQGQNIRVSIHHFRPCTLCIMTRYWIQCKAVRIGPLIT